MDWRMVIAALGLLLALVGLALGIATQEWAMASMLLILGLAGLGAGVLSRRSRPKE